MLTAYPNAAPYKEYITIEITVDKVPEQETSIAWFILPVAVIVCLLLGILIGMQC